MNDDELRRAFDDLLSPLPPMGTLPERTLARGRRRRGLKIGALGGASALAVGGVALLTLPFGSGVDDERVLPPATPSASPSAASPSPSLSPSPSPSPSPAAAPTLVLAPDGLGLASGSSTRRLSFGDPQDTVEQGVAAALGEPRASFDNDCGQQVVEYEQVVLVSQRGLFLGWSTNGEQLATGDGVRVGATLAELRAALPAVEVTSGSLGAEFVAGALSGFLDGTSPSSVVTVLKAGELCLAR